MSNIQEAEVSRSIIKLIEIIAKLRDPIDGCPWDLEQTHNSLIQYVIEEAYEVAHAIRNSDTNSLTEELGDLLLQVVLHSQIASELEEFEFKDVVNTLCEKLIRRHPHVFADKKSITKKEVNRSWEEIKKAEKEARYTKTPLSDSLKEKIHIHPPISGTIKISKKVSQKGFKWETSDEIWNKVYEELNELKLALKSKNNKHAEEEFGDVIFSLINVALWYELDPEEALIKANNKFIDRLSYIEEASKNKLESLSKQELQELWKQAKVHLYQQWNTIS